MLDYRTRIFIPAFLSLSDLPCLSVFWQTVHVRSIRDVVVLLTKRLRVWVIFAIFGRASFYHTVDSLLRTIRLRTEGWILKHCFSH
jgi:hypothetical protein